MQRDDVKRQVQESTDIVQLVGEHVALTARGREFVALCPFHDDSKPSMYVVPAKQIFHCFACGAGGDVFTFVMDYHKMGFREALTFLADRANIKLPSYSGGGRDGDGPTPKERLRLANKQAVDFFRRMLADNVVGKTARDYLAQRGISEPMIEQFAIGYAPDGWDGLVKQVTANKWDRESFELAGLIAKRNSGNGHYDKLRHRLIFPILDNLKQPIAFGGRKIRAEDEPKYLNSPETPLFNKSGTLFGLHLAQKPIIDSRTAIITEGYTDVIACHQAGVRNVIATLGTALTEQHAAKLRNICDRVVLLFDADEAGQKAADRALQVFFNEAIDVDIAVLPDGMDPADVFALPDGRQRWDAAIDAAVDAMSFQFKRVRTIFEQTDTIAGKQRVTREYLDTLVKLGFNKLDTARRGLVIARLADLLLLDVSTVDGMIRNLASAQRPRPPRHVDHDFDPGGYPEQDVPLDPEQTQRANVRQRAERDIIGCLLAQPELFHADMPDGRPFSESIGLADFTDRAAAQLYAAIFEWLMEHETLDVSDLREMFGNEEHTLRVATGLHMEIEDRTDSDPERQAELFAHSVIAIVRERAENEYRQQKMQMRSEEQSGNDAPSADEAQRLDMAVAHMRANPSARRLPRIQR